MTKKNNENIQSSAEFWICNNTFIESDVKVRDYRHITGKYNIEVLDREIVISTSV